VLLALIPLLGIAWILMHGLVTTVDGLFMSLILLAMSGIVGLNVLLELRKRGTGEAQQGLSRSTSTVSGRLTHRGKVQSVQFYESGVGEPNKSIVTLADVRNQSIFLATPNQLHKVVITLTPLPKHLRRVRHLYISAFADPSFTDKEQMRVGYEQRELIRLVASTLLTLELDSDHPIPATLQLWSGDFIAFPSLSQMTISGTTGEGIMASTSTNYPALRFLHLANQQFVNDDDLLPILDAVSSLTYLRISGPYRLSDMSLKCLEQLARLDVGSEAGPRQTISGTKVLLQDEGIYLCSAHFNATKIPGIVLLKRRHLKHAKNRTARNRWVKEGAGLFWEPTKKEMHDHVVIVRAFENYFFF
jgi:hypothetical protein